MTERTLLCPECGLKFVSRRSDGTRTHCYNCVPAPLGTTRGTPCERCGRPSRGVRCSRCRVIVACSKCGGEAHVSGAEYGNPDAKAVCRKCGWAGDPKPTSEEAKQRRRDLVRKRSASVIGERQCEHCGTMFPLTVRGRTKGQRFCSHECDDQAELARRPSINCRDCERSFTVPPSRAGQRLRCPECLEAKRSAPKQPNPKSWRVYFPTCDNCGRLFSARSRRQRLCSPQCKIDDVGHRLNDLYALACQYRHEDGIYTGGQWRKALYAILRERDGDKCGICRRKIDFALKSGTKGNHKGPSIDHIIPRTQGGTDDLANLRCAHWGCNQKRGNRGGNEQLALVG